MIARLTLGLVLLSICIYVPLAGAETLLEDRTGDGQVTFMGFGDSLTYGVGDGTRPGEVVEDVPFTGGRGGYLPRLSAMIGVSALNRGVPGERLTEEGLARFPAVLAASNADLAGLFEGVNDAFDQISGGEVGVALQKMTNVCAALGRVPLVFTLPPPCCDHAGAEGYIGSYNERIRRLATENGIGLVDLARAWDTTCGGGEECVLFNLPEGLHPNSLGYQVIAETAAAALLGIDVFAPEGAAQLEAAAGLPAGTVAVKPDVASR